MSYKSSLMHPKLSALINNNTATEIRTN